MPPSAPQPEFPRKPYEDILSSLKPWGPISQLQPVNPRKQFLLVPAWGKAEVAPASSFDAAYADIKKPFSFDSKWLLTLAIPILAAFSLYETSPVVRTMAGVVNQGWNRMHQAVLDRAAVALDEDFRTGFDNWSNRAGAAPSWTSDASGFVHPAALALYRPSLNLSDYHMQFVGTIDKKALSWAVRAADFGNYYAVRLGVLKAGPTPTIGLTRYAVINGKAQNQFTTPLVMSARMDTVYRVSMDVQGDHYALSVQDEPVDSWSEPKLRHGGIGFFSEQDAGSRVTGVQVRGQYDMLGRLCAFLAPSGAFSYQASTSVHTGVTD